jgi:hypothetical protein
MFAHQLLEMRNVRSGRRPYSLSVPEDLAGLLTVSIVEKARSTGGRGLPGRVWAHLHCCAGFIASAVGYASFAISCR